MDSIFHLEDVDRAAFLEQMVQTFGCLYVCLRYYLPPPNNCLKGFDGIYNERGRRNQEMNGSLARRLFDVYRDSSAYPANGLIPGLAFRNNNPYMKLELHEFHSLVSNDFQLQFYHEAGIKTIVLMGCATGEIELGFSDLNPQIDLETEMKNLIRINFPHHHHHRRQIDPNQPPSSSSSSLRSLSADSPEYPPLLFNIPTTTTAPPPFVPQETLLGEALRPPPTTTQLLSQIRNNIQFPSSIESEDAAMTKAILAVLSTPSPSPSPSPSTSASASSYHNNLPPPRGPTAFRRFRPNPNPNPAPRFAPPKHSRFKRAVLFFRNLSSRPEFPVQGNRPTDTQLHHMISERRRRERLNDSFHILRSFLPSGTKKDKASVLSSTVEYLSSLKSQVAELKKRNLILESQMIPKSDQISGAGAADSEAGTSSSSGERVSVETTQVSSSSSEARFLDLRVTVRGESSSSLLDLVMRLVEFLTGRRQTLHNVISLISVESNTRMLGSVALHTVVMRLKIQGDEFDESGFREAVRRNIVDE